MDRASRAFDEPTAAPDAPSLQMLLGEAEPLRDCELRETVFAEAYRESLHDETCELTPALSKILGSWNLPPSGIPPDAFPERRRVVVSAPDSDDGDEEGTPPPLRPGARSRNPDHPDGPLDVAVGPDSSDPRPRRSTGAGRRAQVLPEVSEDESESEEDDGVGSAPPIAAVEDQAELGSGSEKSGEESSGEE